MVEQCPTGVCAHCGRDPAEFEALVARFGEMVAYLDDHIERRAQAIATARAAESRAD